MFQNLRKGTPVYVLHKQVPSLEIGEVENVGTPMPTMPTYNAGIYQQQKTTVDIRVRIGEQVVNFEKLPSEMTIADFGTNGIVISESRDAVISEIESMRKNSQKVLESVDFHTGVVEKCESMLSELNPVLRQDAERAKDIETLKAEVGNLKCDLTDIKGMLTKALDKRKD